MLVEAFCEDIRNWKGWHSSGVSENWKNSILGASKVESVCVL